jgi:anti-sigma B factor antagonist
MNVISEISGDTLLVKVIGAVDTIAAESLRSELKEIILQKPQKVVLDLSMVPTMGSLGIGKVLMFFKNLKESNSVFEIKGIHENLYSFFKIIKLDKLFPISQ